MSIAEKSALQNEGCQKRSAGCNFVASVNKVKFLQVKIQQSFHVQKTVLKTSFVFVIFQNVQVKDGPI